MRQINVSDENKLELTLQQKVTAELVHLLYTQANFAIVGSMLVATFLMYALSYSDTREIVDDWYVCMLVAAILRYGIVKLYFRQKPAVNKIFFWKVLFITMTLVAGIIWSFAGILLIPHNPLYQIFIASSLAAVTSGATTYYSGSRLACAAFILPILLPFSLWLLMQNLRPYDLLGYLTLLYAALLTISSFKTYRVVYSAILLKFDNDKLLKNLFIAKREMEMINQESRNEINERKLVERLLRDSEEQYRLVTNALPVLISYVDTNLHYRFNNKSHEEWFGKSLSQITGKPMKEILGNTAFSIFAEYYKQLLTKKQITYETIMQFKENDERYVSITLISHIKDSEIRGFFSLISDITPRINYLATHDSLTDLPNRGLFNSRFSHAIKKSHQKKGKVALLFLDLDHFKSINDTLGHDAGDQLLVKVVNKIKKYLRDVDTFARIGGDEFAIILDDITTDELISFTDKLHNVFTEPFTIASRDIFTTASVGVSVYPDDGGDLQILLKNADLALYRAKERGRNTIEFYTSALNAKINRKLTVAACLHHALEEDELSIHYQPIINTFSHKICGLEALLRWTSPKLGVVSPSEFIPVAEEVSLIIPIGEWVFNSTCTQNIAWQKNASLPQNIRTSINLSARQFRDHKLAEKFAAIMQQTGIKGEHLTVELTESLIMHDVEHSTKMIKHIKDLGIAISIDDFGTGYSSLSYLRRFPIDTIKIDRSFITDVACNQEDAAIVRAIIMMAHSLKMKVIAEGVESIEQYNFLKHIKCDEIQGFIISVPVPADQIEFIMQDRSYVKDRMDYAHAKRKVVHLEEEEESVI